MRKLLKKQGFSPKLLITDKLRSHASAIGAIRVELSLLTRAQTKQSGGKTRTRWCDDASASCRLWRATRCAGGCRLGFVNDSPLEGDGFEPSVPVASEPVYRAGLYCGR
jgi:hypothetical protein